MPDGTPGQGCADPPAGGGGADDLADPPPRPKHPPPKPEKISPAENGILNREPNMKGPF